MSRLNPLVTVIVPIYNAEPYLVKCIESIHGQSYTNLEIILVDDGSTDASSYICDEYGERDPRIRVIHQSNRGLSGARNAGVAHSKGEYLCFVDSDDYVERNYVEDLLVTMLAEDAQIAVCGFVYENENGEEIYSKMPPKIDNDCSQNMQEALMNEWSLVIVVDKMYRRELFDALSFTEGKQHEDEFFMHHAFHLARQIAVIDKILYHYVRHEGSITTTKDASRRFDAIEALYDRFRFYEACSYNQLLSSVVKSSIELYCRIVHECGIGTAEEKQRAREMSYLITEMAQDLSKKNRSKMRLEHIIKPRIYPLIRWFRKKGENLK